MSRLARSPKSCSPLAALGAVRGGLARRRGLLVLALTLFGCAAPAATEAPAARTRPPSLAPRFTLESKPSAPAAQLLPDGAAYHLVVGATQEIALLVTTRDGRISGRLRVLPQPTGATVLVDDFSGPPARVDTWLTPDGLRGQATVGHRRVHWQVQIEADGSMTAQRWTARVSGHSEARTNLRRAHTITQDLGRLATELDLELSDPSALELLTLAALSLDLSLRAWDGHGRARLPALQPITN